MSYIQEYPLPQALPAIRDHRELPEGAVELSSIVDGSSGSDTNYVFIKRGQYLSMLVHDIIVRKDGEHYYCDQFDFPLKVLSWFPKALADFRRPPAEGGLHAGAMTTQDENVVGEMLCVQNTVDGYQLVNRSRQSPLGFGDDYRPTKLPLSYHLLYELNFLHDWEGLGLRYDSGEL